MQEILDFVLAHTLEIALPVVVAVLIKALKKSFSGFFKTNHVGVRLLPFVPILLGTPLGLFLDNYEFPSNLLVGAALGGMSHYIYKLLTVSLAKKVTLVDRIERKQIDLSKVKEEVVDD